MTTVIEGEVAANIAATLARIAAALRSAGRDPAASTLVAVSKQQPEDRILAALQAGQRVFGENRVQEAAGRWPQLKAEFPSVELRLIGHLQTNKVKQALALFDVIESVDRPSLAAALAAEMARTAKRVACLIEVNTGEEAQKGGIMPGDADAFIGLCRETHGLPIQGLMCIPPLDEEPSPHFALLAKIARRNGLPVLSMGMSADYEIAVRLGATHVRVGTAVFGARASLGLGPSSLG